ncbi:sperm-egg fusion protein TMEM95-like isoform X2 [Scyliorhinus canicula]|uniref:sperm-egg fusion protein TMEM95-like isoform X2 n=1 Tax=Scyliorhinus canicula TaxID=7830 RepID=UPI0018F7C6A0|nr:sperm-egg fusion protein TMEM95-like isoform X2 [Scyliorhinus canicula]
MRKTASTAMVTGLWLGLVLKAEGCMFCAFPHKSIKDRFERLCAKYKELTETTNCTVYTDADLNKFLIDEMSVDMITEKVHRVLRVIEINQTLTDLPVFWNWLYGVKLPKLTQEAMCAPKCRASTTVINCSVCQEVELNCWNMKTCWPNRLDLNESIYLIVGLSAGSIFIGCITLIFESKRLQSRGDKAVE